MWQTCGFAHVVAHSGGLPGFGSHMRWLPDYGVAIVAMGNLTYTSWGRVTDEAFDGSRGRGPAAAHAATVGGAGRGAGRRERLDRRWDDEVAGRIAADNLFLDAPRAARRGQMEAIREGGACRADGRSTSRTRSAGRGR